MSVEPRLIFPHLKANMDILKLTDNPDVVLLLTDGRRLCVSYETLKQYPYFEDTLALLFKKGGPFDIPREDDSQLRVWALPLVDSDGMAMLVAAAHGRMDLIPDLLKQSYDGDIGIPRVEGLCSFARLYEESGRPSELKPAFECALQQIPKDDMRKAADIVVEAAYLFDLGPCFAGITDFLGKEEMWISEKLRFELGDSSPTGKIHEALRASQERLSTKLVQKIEKIIDHLSTFYLYKFNHVIQLHDAKGKPEGYEYDSDDDCELYHPAVMKCHRELARKVWPTHSWVPKFDLYHLRNKIFEIENPPKKTEPERLGNCEYAHRVMRFYDQSIRELKETAEEGWAGVCLQCFKEQVDMERCSHEKRKMALKARPTTPKHEIAVGDPDLVAQIDQLENGFGYSD